jgi:hypothetical protein
MKMMPFASSGPNHVYACLHLLERLCRLCLVGAQRCSINEKDDFRLVGAQPYVRRSSSTRTVVLHFCLVSAQQRCVQSRCEGTCRWSSNLAS